MSDTAVLASVASGRPRDRHRWIVFSVMLAGEVMDVLDANIINVAGPALGRELGASPAQLQWAIGGYALAMGASLIIAGRLGDIFGRRRMFLTAMTAFAFTSLLCAAAPTIGVLIAGRFLQGAAGALLLPQGFAMLRQVFAADELGKAMAIFGPMLGVAAIAGPVVGGAIVQADVFGLGWRFALAVNVPIACLALLAAWRFVPADGKSACAGGIDWVGALLIASASGLLVLPLVQGQANGWRPWTWASLTAAGAGILLFSRQQRSRMRRGQAPLVEPGLFDKPAFTAGIIGMALFFSAFIGMQLVFTLFLQFGHGFSAGQAGLAGLPLAIGAFVGSGLAGGFLLERIGRLVLQAGAALQIAATAWLWLLLPSDGIVLWRWVPPLALLGLGAGLIIASLITIIIGAADDHEVGSGSGLLAAVQSISSAAGIAVLGGAFLARLGAGDAASGFRLALAVQGFLLVGFLAMTFALPAHARPEAAR